MPSLNMLAGSQLISHKNRYVKNERVMKNEEKGGELAIQKPQPNEGTAIQR